MCVICTLVNISSTWNVCYLCEKITVTCNEMEISQKKYFSQKQEVDYFLNFKVLNTDLLNMNLQF